MGRLLLRLRDQIDEIKTSLDQVHCRKIRFSTKMEKLLIILQFDLFSGRPCRPKRSNRTGTTDAKSRKSKSSFFARLCAKVSIQTETSEIVNDQLIFIIPTIATNSYSRAERKWYHNKNKPNNWPSNGGNWLSLGFQTKTFYLKNLTSTIGNELKSLSLEWKEIKAIEYETANPPNTDYTKSALSYDITR